MYNRYQLGEYGYGAGSFGDFNKRQHTCMYDI